MFLKSIVLCIILCMTVSCISIFRAEDSSVYSKLESSQFYLFDSTIYNGEYTLYICPFESDSTSYITEIDEEGEEYKVDTINHSYYTKDTHDLKAIQELFVLRNAQSISFCAHDYTMCLYHRNKKVKEYTITSYCNEIRYNGKVYNFNGKIMDSIEPFFSYQDSVNIATYRIY